MQSQRQHDHATSSSVPAPTSVKGRYNRRSQDIDCSGGGGVKAEEVDLELGLKDGRSATTTTRTRCGGVWCCTDLRTGAKVVTLLSLVSDAGLAALAYATLSTASQQHNTIQLLCLFAHAFLSLCDLACLVALSLRPHRRTVGLVRAVAVFGWSRLVCEMGLCVAWWFGRSWFVWFVVAVAVSLLQLYFVVVVWSYWMDLRDWPERYSVRRSRHPVTSSIMTPPPTTRPMSISAPSEVAITIPANVAAGFGDVEGSSRDRKRHVKIASRPPVLPPLWFAGEDRDDDLSRLEIGTAVARGSYLVVRDRDADDAARANSNHDERGTPVLVRNPPTSFGTGGRRMSGWRERFGMSYQ